MIQEENQVILNQNQRNGPAPDLAFQIQRHPTQMADQLISGIARNDSRRKSGHSEPKPAKWTNNRPGLSDSKALALPEPRSGIHYRQYRGTKVFPIKIFGNKDNL